MFNLLLFVIFSKSELLAVIGPVGSGKVVTLQEIVSILKNLQTIVSISWQVKISISITKWHLNLQPD